MIDFLMHCSEAQGTYNACAPTPVRNSTFTRCIADAVHRPAFLVLPEFALRIGFGEMAEIVTTSQRALPTKLQEAGFNFQFTELPIALDD